MNGKILSNKKLFYSEDKISVQCDHGYFLEPNLNMLTCENSGKWSAEMPNCTSKLKMYLLKNSTNDDVQKFHSKNSFM